LSGGRVFLEAAGENDLADLVVLERLSFSQPWSATSFRNEMRDPGRGRVVVLREPSARDDPGSGLLAYCAFQVVLDELHILDLAVRPERRRQGWGRRLLARVLELGARRGARLALLEVRRSNWAALALYRSGGFEVSATRRDYYAHPREDALLLRHDRLDQLCPGEEERPNTSDRTNLDLTWGACYFPNEEDGRNAGRHAAS
jgi:ribosomal-protein-alanine N-acetyltransferase